MSTSSQSLPNGTAQGNTIASISSGELHQLLGYEDDKNLHKKLEVRKKLYSPNARTGYLMVDRHTLTTKQSGPSECLYH